jgi:citrate lyase subunit beta / citryl-CoA lyase
MHHRSWLFVPGDSEKKLGKAVSTGADVIVVDLEAGVAPASRPIARRMAAEWLAVHRQRITGGSGMGRWVRINPLDSRLWREDLVAVMAGAPDGIILPRATGPQAVQQLAAELYELEQANQIPTGTTRIIPQVADLPQAAIAIAAYVEASLPRLGGLIWDAESLRDALFARRVRDPRGGWCDAMRHVRAQVLLAAHARGIFALETPHRMLADEKGLKSATRDARADGFTGMAAIHPLQVPVINAAFAPTEEELDEARVLVAAFGSGDGDGGIDRRGTGQPELRQARRILGLAEDTAQPAQPRAPILRSA